ncbi:MAG: HypC/HybG/HupF family hydrogenase formation chaperone [Patescibacteria group bacterium]
MCVAKPYRIIKINGKKAIVESDHYTHEVDLVLIKDPQIGDYVLVHKDIAVNKVILEEAEKIFKLLHENSTLKKKGFRKR